MYWRFISFFLFFSFNLFILESWAAKKNVSLTVSGKNVSESLETALKLATNRYILIDRNLSAQILKEEVIPHKSEFVSSYKIVSGGEASAWMSMDTEIDLQALESIFAISSHLVNKPEAKVLLLFHGLRATAPWLGASYSEQDKILLANVRLAVGGRVERRGLQMLPPLEETQAHIQSIHEGSKSLLRALSVRSGADLVIMVSAKLTKGPDKRGSVKGLRLYQMGWMYSSAKDVILGNSEISMPLTFGERLISEKNPKLLETIASQTDQMLHTLWMNSGSKVLSMTKKFNYKTIRILEPGSFHSVNGLQQKLSENKRIISVIQREITRSHFDFWVDTKLDKASLQRLIKRLNLEDVKIEFENSDRPNAILLKLIEQEEKQEESKI